MSRSSGFLAGLLLLLSWGVAPAQEAAEPALEAPLAAEPADSAPEIEEEPAEELDEGEPEEGAEQVPAAPGYRYTSDIDDAELERRWRDDPRSLGPISVGFAYQGRLVNGAQFPPGPHWTVVDPSKCWGTEEAIAYTIKAITWVAENVEGTGPLRVGHMSDKDGGWLRPHRSHQSGRDVDLALYALSTPGPKGDRFDLKRNWALVRALVTETDVKLILLDKRLQKRLYEYALSIGEDRAWLDSIFRAGNGSILQHARRHRDHFHVRFYSARAQELGRRIQPLLPKRPEYNFAVHKVKKGENLGSIARKYGTSTAALGKANRLKGTLIRAGMTLQVPLRGACTTCPVPPPAIVPPRRLPPATPALFARQAVEASAEVSAELVEAVRKPEAPTPMGVEPQASAPAPAAAARAFRDARRGRRGCPAEPM